VTGWTGSHFARPYLAARIAPGPGPGELELRDGERAMTLTIDGDVGAAASLLTALTQAGSDAWVQLGGEAPPALVALVTDLDRFGWLREADASGASRHDTRVGRLDALVGRARRWLGSAGGASAPEPSDDNLAAAALASCRGAWRRSSPLTHRILTQLLDGASPGGWDPVATAVCDPADIENQVWAALQLVVMSRCRGLDARHRRFVPATRLDGPGVNVLVMAEQCAVALLADLGAPELHRLIVEPGGAARAAPVIFQHRWYGTIRYVEATAGLLRYRLGPSLRALALQYLREEMGHELHELRMCHALGVTSSDLARFAPLALLAACPELLGVWAERRPLSFLLAMTIAEGLPGSGARLPERLAERLAADGIDTTTITAHDDMDQQLNHEMVTRTLLAQLDWVTGAAAAEATSDLLLLIEIAHAGWQILSRYVAAGLPTTPRPFAMTADVVAGLCTPRP
jgi:hypothetical protein